MDEWKRVWLTNSRGCPSPDTVALPIGSAVRVKNEGVLLDGGLWTPQIGFITPDMEPRMSFLSAHMDGFEVKTGAIYTGPPRVDSIYPGGESGLRMYCAGMVEMYCVVTDFKRAFTSMKKNPILTCCPVCVDTERYLNDSQYKDLYDACSKYFVRYWYYGSI